MSFFFIGVMLRMTLGVIDVKYTKKRFMFLTRIWYLNFIHADINKFRLFRGGYLLRIDQN